MDTQNPVPDQAPTPDIVPPVVWYRYDDHYARGEEPTLREFPVARETKSGVWLNDYGAKRFVLNDARKRFAYPTQELALKSYIIRKQRQMGWTSATHDRAKENLDAALRIQRGEAKPAPAYFQFV